MDSLLEYIGNTISENNPHFQKYQVNGVQLPDGRVVQFKDGKESQFIGVSDNLGEAFYVRYNPQVNFVASERRISSAHSTLAAIKQCRLVAYSWKPNMSSEVLMNKLVSDLKNIQFSNLTHKQRPTIQIKRMNRNYIENITEEFKKEAKDIGGFGFICVAIDFDLKYYPSECGECFDEQLINCAND